MRRFVDYPRKDSRANLKLITTYGLLIGFRPWITMHTSHPRATLCEYLYQAFNRTRRPLNSRHFSPGLSNHNGKASTWRKVARSSPSFEGQKPFPFQPWERRKCASNDVQEAEKRKQASEQNDVEIYSTGIMSAQVIGYASSTFCGEGPLNGRQGRHYGSCFACG